VRKEQVQIDKDKVKFGNLENLKLNFLMNAGEAGQGNAYLQSIQNAESQEELFGIGGIQGYTKSLDERLSSQIKQSQLTQIGLEMSQIGKETAAEKKDRLAIEQSQKQAGLQVPALEKKIVMMDEILDSDAIDSVVGTSFMSRGASSIGGVIVRLNPLGFNSLIGGAKDKITGDSQNLIAGVEQLISQEFLDSLIAVKEQGGTFGALQKAEQDALTNAATKIGFWRMETGEGENKKVVGYNASEKDFKKEVQLIQSLAELAKTRAEGDMFTEEEKEALNSVYQEETFNAGNYYTTTK